MTTWLFYVSSRWVFVSMTWWIFSKLHLKSPLPVPQKASQSEGRKRPLTNCWTNRRWACNQPQSGLQGRDSELRPDLLFWGWTCEVYTQTGFIRTRTDFRTGLNCSEFKNISLEISYVDCRLHQMILKHKGTTPESTWMILELSMFPHVLFLEHV